MPNPIASNPAVKSIRDRIKALIASGNTEEAAKLQGELDLEFPVTGEGGGVVLPKQIKSRIDPTLPVVGTAAAAGTGAYVYNKSLTPEENLAKQEDERKSKELIQVQPIAPAKQPAVSVPRKPIVNKPALQDPVKDVGNIEAPPDIRSDLTAAMNDLNKTYKSNRDAYLVEKDNIKRQEFAEKMVYALGQIASGLYGIHTGTDMSGMKFDPTDWAAKTRAAKDEYDTWNSEADKSYAARVALVKSALDTYEDKQRYDERLRQAKFREDELNYRKQQDREENAIKRAALGQQEESKQETNRLKQLQASINQNQKRKDDLETALKSYSTSKPGIARDTARAAVQSMLGITENEAREFAKAKYILGDTESNISDAVDELIQQKGSEAIQRLTDALNRRQESYNAEAFGEVPVPEQKPSWAK